MTAVDKVDLLFVVDDSAAMGDKQAILAGAAPAFVESLVTAPCVDRARGLPLGRRTDPTRGGSDGFGCPPGSEPMFRPVKDIHVGVVSSSLGGMGGDACADDGPTNQRAHLRTTAKDGHVVSTTKPSGFLAWRAPLDANAASDDAITTTSGLATSLAELLSGVGERGCGIAAQLESMYRFLVQPDPWTRVEVDPSTNRASLGGDVDWTLLKQRAAFLRPDSLVVVVLITDDDDASVDPLSVQGLGWAYASTRFPGSKVLRADGRTTTAPRATSACSDDPASPGCTSCLSRDAASDPECAKNGGFYGPDEDALGVRFHHMKKRFGVDPQFPVARYESGLTRAKVPDRATEHGLLPSGEPGPYLHAATCTNPLFAASLPREPGDELCDLPRGTRGADGVVLAVIGGAPSQLLRFAPNDPDGSRLTEADWTRLLGRDPERFDESGIDPHMIQSATPRPGLPPPAPTRGDNGADPVHGREWTTGGSDLQYACTFALPAARTCSPGDASCDCAGAASPPLCGKAPGQQIRAKAYPTIRPLRVAKALGDRAAVASICPITLQDAGAPEYGYTPAVSGVAELVARGLGPRCAPEGARAGCVVLTSVESAADCGAFGLTAASETLVRDIGATGAKCIVPEVTPRRGETCAHDAPIEWCFVENGDTTSPAGRCAKAVHVSSGAGQLRDATLYCPR